MDRTKSATLYSLGLIAIGIALIFSGMAATHWFTRAIAYGMIGGGIAGFITRRMMKRVREDDKGAQQ
jgi:hypothetical protein